MFVYSMQLLTRSQAQDTPLFLQLYGIQAWKPLLPKQPWQDGMAETTVFLTLISLCSSARLSKCR